LSLRNYVSNEASDIRSPLCVKRRIIADILRSGIADPAPYPATEIFFKAPVLLSATV
jgi:hypothetical protein